MRNRAAFRSERGQSITEFALVLPLIVLLLFVDAITGSAHENWLVFTDAVRAGARKGAVSRHVDNPEGVTEAQVRAAATDLKGSDLQVEVSSTWNAGDEVRVSASYPFAIKALGVTIKSGRMHSTTTERVE